MDESPTELFLPSAFPFPIKITSLDAELSADVVRGTRLLSYSFVYLPSYPNALPETRFGTWDSAIEGKLSAWKVDVGDVISQKKARDRPVVVVIEPCKHGTQLGGLCVICGKDMTNVDYTGFSDASRASIQMTHSAFGPTVSLEEAQRIERETAEYLLKLRKLSLIVDLDQTIVHATVDPTVGEWIAEGEAWEARQATEASSSTPTESPQKEVKDPEIKNEDDECNPNWETLKDVKRFRLGPESFGPPSMRALHRKGKHKAVENEGCMYYIKPRPGWKEFLRETSAKYEMHIYTMGTRAYAEEVCAAIDPDDSLFGRRILSRDESGSLTQKSLQRLFPCDTSMVVIIDDRADVWEWSPNLVKVIPYDFFIGIGDINSSFLPKIDHLIPAAPISPQQLAASNGASEPPKASCVDTTPKLPLDTEEADAAELQTTVLLTQNNAVLDAQLEERPLAKKQEELQEHEIEEQKQKTSSVAAAPVKENPATTQKLLKKALLKNDDHELIRIGNVLDEVHSRFFAAYDKRPIHHSKRRRNSISNRAYDVTRIIPRLRSDVFQGVHILFSSVIPLDTKPETTEIWKMADMFGARCSTELTSDITHVVAAKRGTVKVDMARRRGGIKIVWLAWFSDSIALWQRQDETPYLLDDPSQPPPSHGLGHHTNMATAMDRGLRSSEHRDQIADSDIDEEDWDQEPHDLKETGTLELGSINWDDINDEVEAAMNESDDEDGDGDAKSERSHGIESEHASEEEWTDGDSILGSAPNTPWSSSRKRPRSETPPALGGTVNGNTDDDLCSPLAKRKRLVSDSRLKQGITARDLAQPESETTSNASSSARGTPAAVVPPNDRHDMEQDEEGGNEDEEDDDDDDSTDSDDSSEEEKEEDDDDDFLARALEEDMG